MQSTEDKLVDMLEMVMCYRHQKKVIITGELEEIPYRGNQKFYSFFCRLEKLGELK